MKYKKINKLNILEIPYGDIGWGICPNKPSKEIFSDVQLWKKYRELDDYKLSGVYSKACVPVSIEEVEYKKGKHKDVYLELSEIVSEKVYNALNNSSPLLITGGYCKDAVAVCGGMQRYIGVEKKVGIIYLDAHSDMATIKTTTTGILGGMPLAVILGKDMEYWRKISGLERPINPENVLLTDFREAYVNDDGGLCHVKESQIKWLNTDEFQDILLWEKTVNELAGKVDVLYLHIDGDFINSKFAPNVACFAEGGPDIFSVMKSIKTVMNTGKVLVFGIYGFYFDINKPGQDVLTLSGIRLIGSALENWKMAPAFQ